MVAKAGDDQTVDPNTVVTLAATSTGGTGTKTYAWTKVSGVNGDPVSPAAASTTVPTTTLGATTYRVTVTDSATPAVTATDEVVVTVTAVPEFAPGGLFVLTSGKSLVHVNADGTMGETVLSGLRVTWNSAFVFTDASTVYVTETADASPTARPSDRVIGDGGMTR